jgi:energy-coupling factor transporter ATP-binding protein EcfA2
VKIQSLHLKNFKRFTDLRIDGINSKARLVLLIGANGSGKSSVFDAFKILSTVIDDKEKSWFGGSQGSSVKAEYYAKDRSSDFRVVATTDLGVIKNGEQNSPLGLKFYGRSSLRVVPTLRQNQSPVNVIRTNSDAPARLIDLDERFHTDAALFTAEINRALREPVFTGESIDP